MLPVYGKLFISSKKLTNIYLNPTKQDICHHTLTGSSGPPTWGKPGSSCLVGPKFKSIDTNQEATTV